MSIAATTFLPRTDRAAAIAGCILVLVALGIIWTARMTVPRELYVSELGAVGEPTAEWFRVALLLIVAGGSVIAWAGRRVRSDARVLAIGSPAVSLWVGCAFFLLASQVTCTAGCPLPVGETFTGQDFVHTAAAVIAFAAACWAMLQAAFSRRDRFLARLSLATGVIVAVVAGTGGILSLLRWQVALGSRLEFVATTLAIGWLVVFGMALARPVTPAVARPEGDTPGMHDGNQEAEVTFPPVHQHFS